jgi:catechol 2,3-dioxygenase-like lactoylglutathione lyase family enzyme
VPGYDAGMPSGIDHVVIAVADPDAAAVELTEEIGLAFTEGGRHHGLGTFNRIAFLGDAYLELMGVEDPAAAQGWAIGRAAVRALEGGGGLATYGLIDDAIRVTVARLQANGSRIGPVEHGTRERPDGAPVEWLSAAAPELGPDRPPFLIRHLDVGAEWSPDALAARRALVHPIGSPAVLERLDLAVPDPHALAADCHRDLDLDFWEVGSAAVCAVGRHVIRLVADEPETTVVIGAAVASLRSVLALGLRFEVMPATLPFDAAF